MILDVSQIDQLKLRCRVCIVGSGAAGVTLALELGKHKVDVLLVAGGGYEQSEKDRALHKGMADPSGSHEPLEENRHRAFGGSTKRWGGRLVPFDAIDFESRPFMAFSGWPIRYTEVVDRYSRAAAMCETAPDDFRQVSDPQQFDLPDTLGEGTVETTTRERWSTPTDFGVCYRKSLAGSDHVRVLMDYHAINVRLQESLDRVETLYLVSREGPCVQVAADIVVLAAGGMENARLLMASRCQVATGVGNQHDQLGRYYMSHLSGTYGFIRLRSGGRHKPPFYHLAKDRHGVYSRRRFRLSNQAQRDLKAANIIGFPMRPEISDPTHRDAVLSLLYLLEARQGNNQSGSPSWNTLVRHAGNCIVNHPLAWVSIAKQLWLRSRRPRLPFILPFNSRAQDALFFQSEHAPNPESRLLLGEQVDEFDMPRIIVRIRFSDIDYRTVIEFYRRMNLELQSSQLGLVEYDETGLEHYLEAITSRFNSSAHHLGTTRMSADPRFGVVDSDCKVHSVGNLYVAGGSVFPTSSHANPTLTIIALTLRLADHLMSRFREPLAISTEASCGALHSAQDGSH